MTDAPPIEGTAIEDHAVSTALAPRDRTADVLKPVDAGELLESFHAYQSLLPQLLTESDYQTTRDGRFVKKSGWRKIARAFRLNCEVIRLEVERDDEGSPIRATAVVRATAPNGDFQEGDGHCSINEPRFKRDSSRQKIDNDLPATAITRAKNRAISDLVGMGEVSAEEVGHSDPAPARPSWAEPVTPSQHVATEQRLAAVIGDDEADRLIQAIVKAAGTDALPGLVNRALLGLIARIPSTPAPEVDA